jgi:branched-chain amino acid transport system ATP-binding protein
MNATSTSDQANALSPLLSVEKLQKKFGGFTALNGVDLHVNPGERLGLIGPNGSGKSTLVNCVTGVLAHEGGVVCMDGLDLKKLPPHRRVHAGIARSFQIPKPFRSMTVRENILTALHYSRPSGIVRALEGTPADAADRVLEQIGLTPCAGLRAESLSQIDLRKLELARAVACQPKLLIADEAMAGLTHVEVDQILEVLFGLNETGMAIVMIEHIMAAVTRFSQRLVVLVAGEKVADGEPAAVLALPEIERAYLGN